jgi:hypothetical protein
MTIVNKTIEFIHKQVNVDITPCINQSTTGRKKIGIYLDKMDKRQKRLVQYVLLKHKDTFVLHDNGGLGYIIQILKNLNK